MAVDSLSDRYERVARSRAPPRAADGRAGALRCSSSPACSYIASSPTGFLPEIDEGAFVLDYFTPGGTALAETDRQVHIAERILLSHAGSHGNLAAHSARSSACSPPSRIAATSSCGSSRSASATARRRR